MSAFDQQRLNYNPCKTAWVKLLLVERRAVYYSLKQETTVCYSYDAWFSDHSSNDLLAWSTSPVFDSSQGLLIWVCPYILSDIVPLIAVYAFDAHSHLAFWNRYHRNNRTLFHFPSYSQPNDQNLQQLDVALIQQLVLRQDHHHCGVIGCHTCQFARDVWHRRRWPRVDDYT